MSTTNVVRFNAEQAAKVIALYNEGGEKAVERYITVNETSMSDYIADHNAAVIRKYVAPVIGSVASRSNDGTFTRFDVAKALIEHNNIQYMIISEHSVTTEDFFNAVDDINMDNVLVLDEDSTCCIINRDGENRLADNMIKPMEFGTFPNGSDEDEMRYLFRRMTCAIMARLYDDGCGVIEKTDYCTTYKPQDALRMYSSRVYRMNHRRH